jgi:hypothetical protein
MYAVSEVLSVAIHRSAIKVNTLKLSRASEGRNPFSGGLLHTGVANIHLVDRAYLCNIADHVALCS